MSGEEPRDLLQALQDSLTEAKRKRDERRAAELNRKLIERGGQP